MASVFHAFCDEEIWDNLSQEARDLISQANPVTLTRTTNVGKWVAFDPELLGRDVSIKKHPGYFSLKSKKN